jgi:hypothetical protein
MLGQWHFFGNSLNFANVGDDKTKIKNKNVGFLKKKKWRSFLASMYGP